MAENKALVPFVNAQVVSGKPASHYGTDCKECMGVPDAEYIYTWHSTAEQREKCRVTFWDRLTNQSFFYWLSVYLVSGTVFALINWSLGPIYRAPVYALVMTMFFRLIRRNLENKITALGRFTMPQWAGHATFYLFHCPGCNELAVDYVHGYNARLDCNCGVRFYLRSPRFYTDDGREAPLRGMARWKESRRIAEELSELHDAYNAERQKTEDAKEKDSRP